MDAAEDRQERQQRQDVQASSSRRSSSPLRGRPSDDQLYDALWPTDDAVIAAAEAESAEVHALTDAELYERLFGRDT